MSGASGRERPVWSEKKLCSFESVVFELWERFLTAIARVNRGWKPLPPAINHSLKDIELNVVSYEQRLWPKKRPVWSRKKLMNVEHRTSNIERRMNAFCLF